jgi:hypothetical protein
MADLKIKIGAVTDGMTRGIEGAKNKLAKFAAAVKVGFVAAVGAITAAIYAVNRYAKEFDDMAKGSKRIGISVTEFQRLAFAAERTGSNMQSVEKSFKRMQRVINDANKGLKTARDSFKQLGVSVDDLKGKTPEKQFAIITQALNNVRDASEKSALAQEVFGRSGTEIAVLVSEYQELNKQFEVFGGGATKEAIRAAEDYADAITNLKLAFKSLVSDTGIIVFLESVVNTLNKVILGYSIVWNLGKALAGGGTEGFSKQVEIEKKRARAFEKILTAPTIIHAPTKPKVGIDAPLGTTGGSIPSQLQALNKDQALAIGQMLTPLATMATDPQLSELVKMNATLRDIADAQRHQTDATNSYWEGELDNLFNDGA